MTDPRFEAVAVALAVDSVTAQVHGALARAGIRSVLLKGPSFARWLYADGEQRPYGDTDLMVAPADFAHAGDVLAGAGFSQPRAMDRPTHTSHAAVWVRGDGMNVDLHTALIGVRRDPAEAWDLLSADTEPIEVGGASMECLGERARAMHVTLHAAAHGAAEPKTLNDLGRALARVDEATWIRTAELAHRLDAVEAFGAGLRLVAAGERLAERLGIPAGDDVVVRLFAESAPYSSHFVERLAATERPMAKLAMIGSKVAPSPDWMREWTPLARRGRAGLAAAYLQRWLWLARHGPPAVSAWARAKRSAGGRRSRT